MKETFLEKIVEKTRIRVQSARNASPLSNVRGEAERARKGRTPHRLLWALERVDRTNIIAEIKRASPSKGVINANIEVASVARNYQVGGAAAISVLTEGEYFGGSLTDLEAVAETVSIPVLRKDFIIDEYQIYEAAAHGAHAVLLIVAALREADLRHLFSVAAALGLDALVEVHSADEMQIAKEMGAEIIGVNNRNLRSLDVSLDVSRQLIMQRPPNSLMIAESGISTNEQIEELKTLGFNGFLVGEALMRTGNAVGMLGGWV
jgi:indole-3-glycerol phosphate synthase